MANPSQDAPRGVTEQGRGVGDAEQRVQQTRVAKVDLRRLHLALRDVLEPRLKLADHVGAGQQVQVAAHRLVGRAERPAQFRRVPRLTMPVRQHAPETAHGGGGNANAQLRHVTFQKRANEPLAPCDAVVIRRCQVRSRQSATQPEPAACLQARLAKVESAQLDELHPTRQRFRYSAHQLRRRAAQNQEARPRLGPVHQDTEDVEQARQVLDLVQHDEPVEFAQHQLRIGQPADVRLRVQVDMVACRVSASCRARVVLPHCRGPSSAVIGDLPSAVSSCFR